MPKSARSKGLNNCHEVCRILQGIGHKVDGPLYGIAFYNGKQNPIHRDLFGSFDLMSFDGQAFIGHQVSTIENKSTKIKALQGASLPGWVWCRFKDEDSGEVGYQVYIVGHDKVVETAEMVYGIRRRKKAPSTHGGPI